MTGKELEELIELSQISIKYGISAPDFDKLIKSAIEYSKKNNLNLSDQQLIEIIKEAIINNGSTNSRKIIYDEKILRLGNEIFEELKKYQDEEDLTDEQLILEIRHYINKNYGIKNPDDIIEKAAANVLNKDEKRYLKK